LIYYYDLRLPDPNHFDGFGLGLGSLFGIPCAFEIPLEICSELVGGFYLRICFWPIRGFCFGICPEIIEGFG
jgi:hypothetical protein